MLINYWPILIVDDEPDVLAISKMALKRFKHMGIPGKIFTFGSKTEAVEFMKGNQWRYGSFIAVALIDIVMETDEAGLELCDLIRGKMNNFSTQLYIRTGQPGKMNEAQVLERYEVAGYLSKHEANEDKIRETIKSGILRYFLNTAAYGNLLTIAYAATIAKSQQDLRKFFEDTAKGICLDLQGNAVDHAHNDWAQFYGEEVIGTGALSDQDQARQIRETLLKQEPKFKSEAGDLLVEHDGHMLINLAPTEDRDADHAQMIKSNIQLPREVFYYFINAFGAFRNFWLSLPK